MFIVEGLDYAGKSTALDRVKQIVEKQRWSRWAMSGPQIHAIQRWGKLRPDFNYCKDYMLAIHLASQQLCDRFVLSELAYGDVFRGGPHKLFDSHARRRVQRMLNMTGSCTLLVKADWETTEFRAKQRCLSEFDAAMKMRQTYDAMTGAFQRALDDLAIGRRGGTFLGEYDTSNAGRAIGESDDDFQKMHLETIEWYVMQWRTHVERAQQIFHACPKSWGYLWPKTLLVGQKCNGPDDRYPFSGTGSSSRTLTDLLDLAQIGEKDLYLWNAYDWHGDPLLTKEGVTVLAPRNVVALGNEAHEYLAKLDIKHSTFPHPQWVGRFHRKEMNEWATKLRTLVHPAPQSSPSR